jgi:hypothetical protein
MTAAPTLAEIRAAIEELKAVRPDALIATHPQAPRHVREAWEIWCNRMRNLRSEEEKAIRAEAATWRDVTGTPVIPVPWERKPTAELAETRKRIEEVKELRKQKAEKVSKPNGRPRQDHPSRETLQRRQQRAKAFGLTTEVA